WFNPTARHPFNVGFDMNHESPDTKYFFSRVVQHWLQEYKLDGFRFDLSKGFTQVQSNNVGEWNQYDASRVTIWKGYYDTVQLKSSGSYVILEHLGDNPEEKELANYGMMLWGKMSDQYYQAAMGFANSNADLSAGLFTNRGWNAPHLITYAESHDEERVMYKLRRFGNSSGSYDTRNLNTALKRMELVGAFLFTIPGPKMLWQFGELGYDYARDSCSNGSFSDQCNVDMKPIRWNYNSVPERRNVYEVWSKLIKLRQHPWYKANFTSNRIGGQLNGNFRWLQTTTDSSNITVVGNFDVVAQSGTVTFQNAGTWYDLISNTTFTATGTPQNINLLPGEYHVYVNRNVNNVGVTPVSNLVTNGSRLDAGVYPNPARQQFVVDLYLPAAASTSFDLVNGAGQVVRSLRQSFLPRGRQLITLERAGVPAGTYYLRIAAKSGTRVLPLILQ
ncbi:MAG: T9SS type A sorting domain-containing protein, partial [Chitinophagaceae bacterium]